MMNAIKLKFAKPNPPKNEPSKFVMLSNKHYLKYAYMEYLDWENMIANLSSLMPYFFIITKQKKNNILNNFEMDEI